MLNTIINEITSCRICGSSELLDIVDLGAQPLTGVFIKPEDDDPLRAPLNLVCCQECKFLQLKHDVDKDLMYSSYWYRSGTNQTMTDHLHGIVHDVNKMVELKDGDFVIDTGANDGTLLKRYDTGLNRIGVDPSNAILSIDDATKIVKINDFFTKESVSTALNGNKASVVTSISMFYDLTDPERFVEDIKHVLKDDGLWVVEMNYTGDMIESLGYDMISHEHVAYYTFLTFEYLMKRSNMYVNDVSFNTINGGSMRLFVKKSPGETKNVTDLRNQEIDKGFLDFEVYKNYKKSIENFKQELIALISDINSRGETVMAYGASTRGNTIMQHCEFTREDIPAALDRLPLKYGLEMSGCRIPIISEKEGRDSNPEYLLALPYYFIDEFVEREKDYLKSGGKFIVFLPKLRIISYNNLGELETKYLN